MRHHLTHAEEARGGHHSHEHHKKMHDHHLKEAKKHAHAAIKAIGKHREPEHQKKK